MRLCPPPPLRRLAVICLVGLLVSARFAADAAAEEPAGAQLYEQKCASCHGAKGEGTEDHYPEPLVGDRPLVDLTRVIVETMPEGDPDACVGEEAALIAAYIYDAFYSPIAQDRNRPARVEFSRLTVRQYENAVADLLGAFSGGSGWGDERGLQAEYFSSRRLRNDQRVLERRDPVVDFEFGESSPVSTPGGDDEEEADDSSRDAEASEDDEPPEFSVRWQGSLLAPETGDYEFILETENGARLWLNDNRRALIDAWVRSGDQTEYRETIRLLGGRVYPVRLEFFRFQEPRASIRLKWKPPHQAEQVIPERCLSPLGGPEVFVLETPFPPDDRSIGYERGTSVSKAWIGATTYAAVEVAGHVADNLPRLAGLRDGSPPRGRRRGGRFGRGGDGDRAEREEQPPPASREERIREFCHRFAERAFRRPLSEEERRMYVDRQFEAADDPETAVRRVVLLVLQSPRFLYREAGAGDFDAFAVASWISFALWDSLPDRELLDAAAAGQLETRVQIAAQVERMLPDLRTRAKLRAFLHQWLQTDHFHDVSRDPELFPDFDEMLLSDLRTSLDLFLEDVVWSEGSDFRRLLTSDVVYLNDRLARFYGVELPARTGESAVPETDAEPAAEPDTGAPEAPFVPRADGFLPVSLDPEHRAGVLSHPYLMAGFADRATSSPIHRGVFLARSLLGRVLRPPPDAVTPLAPELHPDLTTRERVTLQTSPQACRACHELIDPLGFSLEHFDAVGRLRTEEKSRPIDASGHYLTRTGDEVRFTGARELAAFLAGADEAHDAFVERLFTYMLKQPIRAFGDDQRAALRRSFVENGFSIQRLLADAVTESALKAGMREERPRHIERQSSLQDRGVPQ